MRYHNTSNLHHKSGEWHFGPRSHVYWSWKGGFGGQAFGVELIPSRGLSIRFAYAEFTWYWWRFHQSCAYMWGDYSS